MMRCIVVLIRLALRAKFFFPMVIGILSIPTANAVQVVAGTSGNWSSTATWIGGVLPGVEDTVKIPTGLTVTLNADVECGGIVVEGKLTVERANRTLLCDYLLVQTTGAVFEVGTNASRFTQNFTLTLKGLSTESPLASMGAKLLGAHNGGTLDIHARDRVEWTHLGVNAAAGATSLTLAEAVDWAVGDSIMVTSSRQSWSEAETRTITAVSADMKTVSFNTGLSYLHNGSTITKTRSTDNKSWTVDMRAEVALLSRNVKIQGDAVSETAGFGGHIMVMNGGTTCCVTNGRAFIEGVELYRMGQKSALGRYPMHWHMVAEGGAGQYFRDSVVRHSFNRAITIHGTESTLVENNFCYDHLGHGIFLEDGSERFNVIRKNVVLATTRPAVGEEILDTDNNFITVQNRSPASFWITNPNNTITDNVAAGTHGTGYWFAFPQKPLNASLTHPRFAGLEPYKQPLGAFDRNTAHSCASGLDINDQLSASDTLVINGEWANNGPFSFNDCTWYSNDVALYAGIGGGRKNVIYNNNVFADNQTNLFLATYHLCQESLMIADSGFGLLPSSMTRTVYAIYDGAGRMRNNHLYGWNATNSRFLQNIGAATKHPNHVFEGFTFDPPVPPRSILTDYNIIPPANIGANDPGHPRIWAGVILDLDGSISGIANSSIVSNHPFFLTGGETRPSVWTNTYRSSHRFAQCVLNYGQSADLYPNISVLRSKPGTPTAGIYYINGYKEQHQLPLIVREDFQYTYLYESLPTTKRVDLDINDATVGDDMLICFKNFGQLPGIAVTGMTSRASLAALKAGTTSGFYKETNGDFYIRPIATAASQSHTLTWTTSITMPVVDSDGDGVSDGDEAAAGTDPFRTLLGTDPFVDSEFDVTGNFENWASFTGVINETVASGTMSARSSNADPQMFATNLRVSGSAVRYLLVRFKASANGVALFSWKKLNDAGFTTARSVSANYTGSNQWQTLIFPMLNNAEWQNQVITDLRFDPVAANNVDFQIDYIRASNGISIGPIANQTIPLNSAAGPLAFTIGHVLLNPSSLLLSVASSNTTLVPLSGIVLGGSGADRTATITPAALQVGSSLITITVSDGQLTDSTTFTVTVDEFAFGRFAYLFNQDANFEGWVGNATVTSANVAAGALNGTLIGTDPQLNHSAAVDLLGSNMPTVLVRMKSSAGGTGQLFFGNELTGISAANSVTFAVAAGSVFKWYAVNVAANTNWTGHTIKALRLDPPNTTGTVSIDAIIGSDGDFNQDGIPDVWEVANQLDPTAPADALRDTDGDGLTDASEFVLGTNPGARTTALLSTATVGANITLTFTAAAATGTGYSGLTRIYDVETTTNLANPASWSPLAGYANITGANQTVVVTQPLSGGPRFYRLKVRLQ